MKKLIQFLAIALLIVGCSKSEDSDTNNPEQVVNTDQVSTLVGNWSVQMIEVRRRCDNGEILPGEEREPDFVDEIADLEFLADGRYYALDHETGERQPWEDMSGTYDFTDGMLTTYYTLDGEPRSWTAEIFFTDNNAMEYRNITRCETRPEDGFYYLSTYIRVD